MASPRFFKDAGAFRKWFEKHAATKTELIVGYYKVNSGRPSMTWPESVDQALCFGWIDGIRRRIDEEAYQIRFTPRRPGRGRMAYLVHRLFGVNGQGGGGRSVTLAHVVARPTPPTPHWAGM